ncbi:MAG: PKD domain-containing protein [Myxococcales bacterium]
MRGHVRWMRALALAPLLGLWSGCSSQHPSAASGGSSNTSQGGAASAAAGVSTGAANATAGAGGHGLDLSLSQPSAGDAGTSSVYTTPDAGELCQPPQLVKDGCMPALDDEPCNGLDDDCDGTVDENCPCKAGDVQPCFLGPPGRRGVGACVDGTQLCRRGGEFAAHWGECTDGIRPSPETCDGLDNDCNGCTDDLEDCKAEWKCPGPGDPRTPDGLPLAPYPLRGHDFYEGAAKTWSWTIQGGPCDALTATPSFTLEGADSETATFTPKLSGDYTVTLTVTPEVGPPFKCSWIVHIEGPGLRIELCYPESTTYDLDLYVKQPGKKTPWFTGTAQFSSALDQCCWANCEANLRPGDLMPAQTVTRADWGYPTSPLSLCENDLQGAAWQTLGYCASPRLDIDNNLVEATGVPENINVDAPRENETFRVMVANFTGADAHPLVNVYCDGRRVATIGAAPDGLTNFSGTPGSAGIGPLWRVADITTHVTGGVTSCTVDVLHPPGTTTGFDVTVDDARY